MKSFLKKIDIEDICCFIIFDTSLKIINNYPKERITIEIKSFNIDNHYDIKHDFYKILIYSHHIFADVSMLKHLPNNIKFQRLSIINYEGEFIDNNINVEKLEVCNRGFIKLEDFNYSKDLKFDYYSVSSR